jgi:hypothetical protein
MSNFKNFKIFNRKTKKLIVNFLYLQQKRFFSTEKLFNEE